MSRGAVVAGAPAAAPTRTGRLVATHTARIGREAANPWKDTLEPRESPMSRSSSLYLSLPLALAAGCTTDLTPAKSEATAETLNGVLYSETGVVVTAARQAIAGERVLLTFDPSGPTFGIGSSSLGRVVDDLLS
jgi:hypothetical protein